MKSTIFWDMTPCSLQSFNDVSEEHIASIFGVKEISSAKPASKQVASKALLVSCSAYSSTLKMEAIFSSEDDTVLYPRR
jgi:hypothetical protein